MPRTRWIVATAAAWSALALGVLVTAFSLPIDDFWLSLASARAIAAGADPARAINLTWTPMVDGALNPQWGAQVIFGAVDQLGWALAVNAALIGIGLLLTVRRVALQSPAAATSLAMIATLGVLAPHLLARAQSFSIALLPLALLLLERTPRRVWLPIVYGLLMVAWANLHGAFVVGQIAAVAFFIGAAVDATRGRGITGPLWIPGVTALVAFVAPVVNPAGMQLLAYAYAQPALEVVRQISVEWQPSYPWVPVATLFWIFLGVLVVGRIIRRGGASIPNLLLGAGLGLLAIGSIRQIPWFVLAMAPLLGDDIAALLRARPGLSAAIGAVRGPLGDRRAAAVLVGAAALCVLIQPLRPLMPADVARITPDAPVALADALADQLGGHRITEERVLNEQVWGGYLAYRMNDSRLKTAADGRLEIRDRQTWIDYFDLMHGEGDPAARLEESSVHWAMIDPSRAQLEERLLAAGWQVVTRDDKGVLLHRN